MHGRREVCYTEYGISYTIKPEVLFAMDKKTIAAMIDHIGVN